jgi:hypothetical protein
MESLSISKKIGIREAGFDEEWLQNQIWENPTEIGIGELETISKEAIVSSGGRLDTLLLILEACLPTAHLPNNLQPIYLKPSTLISYSNVLSIGYPGFYRFAVPGRTPRRHDGRSPGLDH